MDKYYKIVDNRLVQAPVNLWTENGVIMNFNVNKRALKKQGYKVYSEQEIAEYISRKDDITNHRFSKLKVKHALQELGLWETVKNSMTEDELEDFIYAQDLSFDNACFVKFYNMMKEQIDNAEDVLRGCIL